MNSREHAGHTICGSPDCRTFHLFCAECGSRYHFRELAASSGQPALTTQPAQLAQLAQPALAQPTQTALAAQTIPQPAA
jgi:hypothetical protein